MSLSGLLEEVRAAREGLVSAAEGGRGEEMQRYLLELQRCMLRFRETGNEKLEVTSELLDTVSFETICVLYSRTAASFCWLLERQRKARPLLMEMMLALFSCSMSVCSRSIYLDPL